LKLRKVAHPLGAAKKKSETTTRDEELKGGRITQPKALLSTGGGEILS